MGSGPMGEGREGDAGGKVHDAHEQHGAEPS